MSPHIFQVGERVEFYDLKVIKRSTYQKEICGGHTKGKEKIINVWRYVFASGHDRNLFVYSGVWLSGIDTGNIVHVKATIKRMEVNYNTVRLARVVIIGIGERELLI